MVHGKIKVFNVPLRVNCGFRSTRDPVHDGMERKHRQCSVVPSIQAALRLSLRYILTTAVIEPEQPYCSHVREVRRKRKKKKKEEVCFSLNWDDAPKKPSCTRRGPAGWERRSPFIFLIRFFPPTQDFMLGQ